MEGEIIGNNKNAIGKVKNKDQRSKDVKIIDGAIDKVKDDVDDRKDGKENVKMANANKIQAQIKNITP